MTDWKTDLSDLFKSEKEITEAQKQKAESDAAARAVRKQEAASFFSEVVEPAFNELAVELKKHERKVSITGSDVSRVMEIRFQDKPEFEYMVEVSISTTSVVPVSRYVSKNKYGKKFQIPGYIKDNPVSDVSKPDIINDFLRTCVRSRISHV